MSQYIKLSKVSHSQEEACMHAQSLQSCLALCESMECSLPGSSVHEILQVSGLPFPSPGDLPDPGIKPASLMSPALAGGFFTTSTTWEAPVRGRARIEIQPELTVFTMLPYRNSVTSRPHTLGHRITTINQGLS